MSTNKKRPTITTQRAAQAFREMVSLRRIYCDDDQFFKMIEVWEWLSDDNPDVRIKAYDNPDLERSLKAGVIAFGDKFTLVVSDQMIERAKKGSKRECMLANYTLAHEYSHIALGHHDTGGIIKNFQLFATDTGVANIPPSAEELEANLAAVFFQCGVKLLDSIADPVDLAKRANTDIYWTKKALTFCKTPTFREELSKITQNPVRVVL